MAGYGYCHLCDRTDAATLYGSPSYGWLWHCADHADCTTCPRGEGSTGYTGPRSTIMDTLREINKQAGRHWFEPDTMRFFRSRVAERAYLDASGSFAFFVSSERFDDDTARLYSVRVMHLTSGENPRTVRGDIDTVGAFQGYRSRSGADHAARRLAADPSDYAAGLAMDAAREATG